MSADIRGLIAQALGQFQVDFENQAHRLIALALKGKLRPGDVNKAIERALSDHVVSGEETNANSG